MSEKRKKTPNGGSLRQINAAGGQRNGAGRKRIGATRKLSLTLPASCWQEIDRRCGGGDYSVSEIVRSIIEDSMRDVDIL
ncbi:hypothetical protein FE782_10565 [Paenibacillus antri]|uniref:Uncharacterized protein n=1 Tax=Paenibacillus antri TaxID=2582848 RepID=A0A5R9G7L0_9BACL|nr:hypothetical protein [Paenibacillus antri]TLS52402.1 hypothetical protein FE782_10565 [Paenibacillus antri]